MSLEEKLKKRVDDIVLAGASVGASAFHRSVSHINGCKKQFTPFQRA